MLHCQHCLMKITLCELLEPTRLGPEVVVAVMGQVVAGHGSLYRSSLGLLEMEAAVPLEEETSPLAAVLVQRRVVVAVLWAERAISVHCSHH